VKRNVLEKKGRLRSPLKEPGVPAGYVPCPNRIGGFVHFIHSEVCRIQHYFWDWPLLESSSPSEFAKKYCKRCRLWCYFMPPDRVDLLPKHVRHTFVAPLQKYKRAIAVKVCLPKMNRIPGKRCRCATSKGGRR